MIYLANKDNIDDLIEIFSQNKEDIGDSGYLFETSFGKIEGEYTMAYFDRIKNIRKLIFYPEYFVLKKEIFYLNALIINIFRGE